jgi:hypothetical protein
MLAVRTLHLVPRLSEWTVNKTDDRRSTSELSFVMRMQIFYIPSVSRIANGLVDDF